MTAVVSAQTVFFNSSNTDESDDRCPEVVHYSICFYFGGISKNINCQSSLGHPCLSFFTHEFLYLTLLDTVDNVCCCALTRKL